MRVALCDADVLIRDVVESVVTSLGHEVVGVADTTAGSVGLIEAARPELVVLDISLGVNSDFDVVDAANAIGARVIVFSHTMDAELLGEYSPLPTVVEKPDLLELERAIVRLEHAAPDDRPGQQERRQRPARAASGRPPTGLDDAQAFFESVNDAAPGDGLIAIEVEEATEPLAAAAQSAMRETDRLLAARDAVRLYLPAGGEDGVRSVVQRLAAAGIAPPGSRITAVVVRDGEDGAAAFDRLRHEGEEQRLMPTDQAPT